MTDTEALKNELIALLGALDKRALDVIGRLKKRAVETNDTTLLGYVYYRYAYFYYYTFRDIKKMYRNLRLAIRYLVQSGDHEYLGCAYNLVAYDAQDHGCYDTAYAYYMLAFHEAKQVRGIALPGLIEGNAGRLMTEIGYPEKGRKQLRSAFRRLRPFTSMQFYYYNMILTLAEEALAAFLMGDRNGVESALREERAYYEKAEPDEQRLSLIYHLMPPVYLALLSHDKAALRREAGRLYRFWRTMDPEPREELIFEVESLFQNMIANRLEDEAEKLLRAVREMAQSENASIALRYYSMRILLDGNTGHIRRQRKNLLEQHRIAKRFRAEQIRMQRYAMEFVEHMDAIAEERNTALQERDRLRKLADTDALTLLPNRSVMNRRLTELFEEARRETLPFAIGILDVDRFKHYNDTNGHQAGDDCLRMIGSVLNEICTERHLFCARYGGDEFVVCYTGQDKEAIRRVANLLRKRIAERTVFSGNRMIREPVRVSQGICHGTPDGTQKLWDYLSAADQILYRIKKRGGNGYRLSDIGQM